MRSCSLLVSSFLASFSAFACGVDPEPPAVTLEDSSSALLGTITPDGDCPLSSLLAGDRCEQAIVTCEGLAPATVRLVIAEPTAPLIGTVIFGSGSAGASLMEQAATGPGGVNPFVEELEGLRAAGYRVIQRAWQGDAPGDRGWIRGSEGMDASACRYATLVTWVAKRFASPTRAMCSVGFSGGSMELAQVLGRWNRGGVIDQAVLVSGPAARSDEACIGGAAAEVSCAAAEAAYPWECADRGVELSCVLGDDITLLVDTAYGGAPVCSSRDPSQAPQLAADSVLAPGIGVAAYPATRLDSILGMRDCGSGAATTGATWATLVTGAGGAAPAVVAVPGAGHTVHATPQGAAAIAEAVLAGCTPR